jgi:hypothetical protein
MHSGFHESTAIGKKETAIVNWILTETVPPELMFEYEVEVFNPQLPSRARWGIAYQAIQVVPNTEQDFSVRVSAVPTNGTPPPPDGGAAWDFHVPPYSGEWLAGVTLGPLFSGCYNLTIQQIDENGEAFGPIYEAAADIPVDLDGPLAPGGIDGGRVILLPEHRLFQRAHA